jgi:two-component system sensor histidine kinase BaeS
LSALLLALLLSFLLIKRVLDPLAQMTEITRSISSGNYSVSIPIRSKDEVGQLAMAFNRMADSLQKIERLRKTMMIDVAHELRTPLSNIQEYLEALIDGVVPASRETFTSCPQSDAKRISIHNFRRNGQNIHTIYESGDSSYFCQYRC